MRVLPLALVLFTGCTHHQADIASLATAIGGNDELLTDDDGERLNSGPSDEVAQQRDLQKRSKDAQARERAFQNNALQFGSQGGFRHRLLAIAERLEFRSGELSVIFDFNRVVTLAPNGVGYLLPPVVIRSEDAFTLDRDDQMISAADVYFEILRAAQLLPTPPTWRDYLLINDGEDHDMRQTNLVRARSAAEKRQQDHWIEAGWQAGIAQADDEFVQRLRRLKRDFEGMLEFRRLKTLRMIDPPETFSAEFGITGESGQMRLGDRVAKIVKDADFHRQPADWHKILD